MHVDAIDYIQPSELGAGEILRRFRGGAQVVCLHNDDRLLEICSAFLDDASIGSDFWNDSVFDLAQNHIAGETNFGDVLRFVPGDYGHLARKFACYPDPDTGQFVVYPPFYGKDKSWVLVQQKIFKLAWNLAIEVAQSATSEPLDPNDYAVKIELLKYPSSADELQKLFDLISDSTGRWSKWGQKIDFAVATACGLFRNRLIKHPYALASHVPFIGGILRSLNDRFRRSRYHSISNQRMIVGPPHKDGHRYLTMLAGERSAMTTEFFCDGAWARMPVNPTTLAIFPTKVYERSAGVPATVHRYAIDREKVNSSYSSKNVTVLIGVISRDQLGAL
ncbi:MAG: hypothetical protein KJP16_10665 [Gammaproteobacteria bacterium]|nr:hypothetical protein [Woeseia sp.]MBU2677538.1 hypothetical protein [Gammaproteobacteria bacterium]NNL51270.1 hypothetical protein [Woeseiaceae bacterium]